MEDFFDELCEEHFIDIEFKCYMCHNNIEV